MAQRRMFAKSEIRTFKFSRLSSKAQVLYFNLSLEADDEGYVEAGLIMQSINATEKEYLELYENNYVEKIDGCFLTLIVNWEENNNIPPSKMTPSKYHGMRETRTVDSKLHNGRQSAAKVQTKRSTIAEEVQTNVCKRDTQVSIGKVSIDKVSKDISSSSKIEQEFESLWELYPRKQGKKKALEAYKRAVKAGATYEAVKTGIDGYTTLIQCTNIQPEYIKHGSTWFGNACWEDDYKIPANTGNASVGKKVKLIPDWADEKKTEQSEVSPEEKARRDAEFEKLRQQALEAGM